MTGRSPLRLATRGSPLARRQADVVTARLAAAVPGLAVEPVVVRTDGDRRVDVPLDRIGGQGVFVRAIQEAVAEGRADVAVHSAKDLPSETPDGLCLAAVPERGDPRDALVGGLMDRLPTGARVATGSARRRAQLANLRPDLTFVELRGNMATRVGRAGSAADAVVVAAAAMDRLGWADRIAERLPPTALLPQIGQGALAVECRADDEPTAALLAAVDDPLAHRAVAAERALLAGLAGSCAVPVGGWCEPPAGSTLRLHGMVASGDGRVVVRATLAGTDPVALGRELAARLLDGGGRALDEWATRGHGGVR